MDPHYHNLGSNIQISKHIFDSLIDQDAQQRLVPALATSWKLLDPTTWEFRLREGVVFHDDSPFTARDVAFTFRRVQNVPGSPSSFSPFVRQIESVRIIDDHTLHLRTKNPYPLLPNDLSNVFIVSESRGEGASTADYNSGKAAVGTGPFMFKSYAPGDRIHLTKSPTYWGKPAEWDQVIFRSLASNSSRIAALLAGDVDLVEQVPPPALPSLKSNMKVKISSTMSNRLIYLYLDTWRDRSPMIRASDGGEIPNPLKDPRVRRALSLAIDRQGLADRVLGGMAVPAGQVVPPSFPGASLKLSIDRVDPVQAKALLTSAGHPRAFSLTIHGPNDRYVMDSEVLQAIAQMFTRVGVSTSVDVMTSSVYFRRASALEFSTGLVGFGSGTGEASLPLRQLLATYDQGKGWGAINRGRYSNAEFDALLSEALATVDDEKRRDLLARATELAVADTALIPLYFQVNVWATRNGLTYQPRTDEHTIAMGVSPDPTEAGEKGGTR